MKLQGKVALVSGSGHGIGRAVAHKLASEGARLVINDLDEDPAQEAAEAIRALGAEVAVCAGDVAAPDFGNRFVRTALDAYGGLHIIANNAGYTWDSVIQKMSDEQFDAMLDVHLKAPFRILRAAADPLREAAKREAAEGRTMHRKVVNVSSVSGVWGNAGQVNYAAGKAGILGITRTLAREWGRYRVNVNAVAFGLIATRMTQAVGTEGARINVAGRALPAGIPENAVRAIEAQIPLGRGGTPEEAAGAVYSRCSNATAQFARMTADSALEAKRAVSQPTWTSRMPMLVFWALGGGLRSDADRIRAVVATPHSVPKDRQVLNASVPQTLTTVVFSSAL